MTLPLFDDDGGTAADEPMVRCISLWQPWATAIALGLKTFETRSWYTEYRGRVAIHAAKRWHHDQQEFIVSPEIEAQLDGAELPLGGFVAIVDLVACIAAPTALYTAQDGMWGDFRPGRYAWLLEEVRAIEFIEARGQQGFWSVPESTFEPEALRG